MFAPRFLVGGEYPILIRKRAAKVDAGISISPFVTTVVTVAMLWPLEAPRPAPEGSDKLVHFIAFAALAFPLARTGRFGLIPVLIGASAFGAIIELIQPTFNRSAELSDWVADTLGVLIGIGLGLAYRRVRRHRF